MSGRVVHTKVSRSIGCHMVGQVSWWLRSHWMSVEASWLDSLMGGRIGQTVCGVVNRLWANGLGLIVRTSGCVSYGARGRLAYG